MEFYLVQVVYNIFVLVGVCLYTFAWRMNILTGFLEESEQSSQRSYGAAAWQSRHVPLRLLPLLCSLFLRLLFYIIHIITPRTRQVSASASFCKHSHLFSPHRNPVLYSSPSSEGDAGGGGGGRWRENDHVLHSHCGLVIASIPNPHTAAHSNTQPCTRTQISQTDRQTYT